MNMGKKVGKPRMRRSGNKKTGVGPNFSDIPIIPEEVLAWDILPRLPTKSLMRFRSVCKSWNSLITYDTNFHNLHVSSMERNQGRSRGRGSSWISLESSLSHSFADRVNLHDESFRCRPKPVTRRIIFHEESVSFMDSKIIDSCNGVVCFYFPIGVSTNRYFHPVEMSIRYGGGNSFLCFCNPSIQKSKRVDIPWKLPPFSSSIFKMMMGFGYANLSSDYKVVMITNDISREDHVYVYTLRKNSWIKTETKPPALWTENCRLDVGTYFDGACHWLRKIAGIRKLVCFNLNNEKFRHMKLPKTTHPEGWPAERSSSFDDDLQILVYKNMLCVWFTCINITGSNTIQIWGLKDLGNPKSWTSLLHVCMKDDGPKKWLNYNPTLFGIDVHGSLLFNSNGYLSSYNPHSKQWKMLKLLVPCQWRLISYKESLALIDLDHQTDAGGAFNGPRQTRLPALSTELISVLCLFVFTCLFFQGILLFPLLKTSLC